MSPRPPKKISPGDFFVTGNTVIDALHMTIARAPLGNGRRFGGRERYILMTAHRRENFGDGRASARIAKALRARLSGDCSERRETEIGA